MNMNEVLIHSLLNQLERKVRAVLLQLRTTTAIEVEFFTQRVLDNGMSNLKAVQNLMLTALLLLQLEGTHTVLYYISLYTRAITDTLVPLDTLDSPKQIVYQ